MIIHTRHTMLMLGQVGSPGQDQDHYPLRQPGSVT